MCQRLHLLPAFMLLLFVLPLSAFASPPLLETEWTFDPGESAVGSPIPLPRGEAASAIVVTLSSGKALLAGPHGEKRATMRLDLPR